MVTEVTRHVVRRLVDEGAQLVDVLESKEYADSHLPDAVHIPLAKLPEDGPRLLDRKRPVVTYCYDSLCDLSPRAAWRLDSLGFSEVYDYVASKVDWLGAGLPFEGERARQPHLAMLAEPAPTCSLDDSTGEVRSRLGNAPACIVVDVHHVVLGLADADALDSEDARIAEVMHEAPRTYRPHVTPAEIAGRLDKPPHPWLLVTNLDGTLVGLAPIDKIRQASRDE